MNCIECKHGMEAGKGVVFPEIIALLRETCWYAFEKKIGLGENCSCKRLDFAAAPDLLKQGPALAWV